MARFFGISGGSWTKGKFILNLLIRRILQDFDRYFRITFFNAPEETYLIRNVIFFKMFKNEFRSSIRRSYNTEQKERKRIWEATFDEIWWMDGAFSKLPDPRRKGETKQRLVGLSFELNGIWQG